MASYTGSDVFLEALRPHDHRYQQDGEPVLNANRERWILLARGSLDFRKEVKPFVDRIQRTGEPLVRLVDTLLFLEERKGRTLKNAKGLQAWMDRHYGPDEYRRHGIEELQNWLDFIPADAPRPRYSYDHPRAARSDYVSAQHFPEL